MPHVTRGRRQRDVGRRRRRPRPRGRGRRGRQARRRRAARSKGCTSGRSTQAHAAAYDPVARLELMDEIGIWAQIIFPGVVGLGGQALAERRAGRRAAHALPRDLQRRERRDPGRVRQPAAADGDPARVGRRRVRARGAARERPRSARREPHVRSAGPRCARPREPRVGPGVGGVQLAARCRCTSTSARASRR